MHRLNVTKCLTAKGELKSTSAPVLISYFSQHFSSNPLHNYMNCQSFPEAVSASCIHFQMAKRSCLGTRSNHQCSLLRAIDNPLEVSWHICQEPPRVLQNSSPSEESKEGGGSRKVLTHSFNMLIGPGAASVSAKLDTSKGNFFKVEMSFSNT